MCASQTYMHVQDHYSTQTLHSYDGSMRRWSLTEADKKQKTKGKAEAVSNEVTWPQTERY